MPEGETGEGYSREAFEAAEQELEAAKTNRDQLIETAHEEAIKEDKLWVEEEKAKRTKEAEISANCDFWKEMGVEVDEEDVRTKIEAMPEVEGFDWYLYIPDGNYGGFGLERPFRDASQPFKNVVSYPGRGGIGDITWPRQKEKNYVVAARYQQEPDKDTLSKKDKHGYWSGHTPEFYEEKEGLEFMNPVERAVA